MRNRTMVSGLPMHYTFKELCPYIEENKPPGKM